MWFASNLPLPLQLLVQLANNGVKIPSALRIDLRLPVLLIDR